MATQLELALLSMDVYEKGEGGLNGSLNQTHRHRIHIFG